MPVILFSFYMVNLSLSHANHSCLFISSVVCLKFLPCQVENNMNSSTNSMFLYSFSSFFFLKAFQKPFMSRWIVYDKSCWFQVLFCGLIQRSHFCLVEIQSGTSLDHGIENTLTGSGLIGQPGRDTGNPQEKTGE